MESLGSEDPSVLPRASMGEVLLEGAAPHRERGAAREVVRGKNQSGVYANGRLR